MKPKSTIASLLQQATESLYNITDSPKLDAEVLLAHSLGRNRTYLFTWPDRIPTQEQVSRFQILIDKRRQLVPVAHLTEEREFWSLNFKVSANTLIPRPETELLVELAVQRLQVAPGPVLDLGTGSGIIAISIAHEVPTIRVDAVDECQAALNVATHNAARHDVDVNFMVSDWFSNVRHRDYRMIVSNPPYLDMQDEHLNKDGLWHEPRAALVADNHGMADIQTIISKAAQHTSGHAELLIEHGYTQGPQVRALMQQQGFQQVTTHRDIESRERVTLAVINK